MIPNMAFNSRQMKQLMKQLGMKQEEIDAQKVLIIMKDKKIVFENPSVVKVNMMGEESFQIVGDYRFEDNTGHNSEDNSEHKEDNKVYKEDNIENNINVENDKANKPYEPTEDDIRLVTSETNVDRETAISALRESNGDIAEAILSLKEGKE